MKTRPSIRIALLAVVALLSAYRPGTADAQRAPRAAVAAKAKAQAKAKVGQNKRVIVFVGMPGSGKSFASQRLAKQLKIAKPLISGDIIREAVGPTRTKEEQARKVLEVATRFNTKHKGEIGRRMAKKAMESKDRVVIVEGFRSPVDVAEFKKAFPDSIVVNMDVPDSLRHERMLSRGRAGEDNMAYLKKRDKQERSVGVGRVIKSADMQLQIRTNNLSNLDRELARVAKQVAPRAPRKNPRKK